MWDYKQIHIELLCLEFEEAERLLTESIDKLTPEEIEHYKKYQDEIATKLVEMMLVD
jgi:hypothetical protein